MKALIHFYEKNLNQCYSGWKAITVRNKRLRKCFQKVNYQFRLQNKDFFFNEWMKRCYQNEMSRRIRRQQLLSKFIETLKQAVRLRNVRNKILEICQFQYLKNLQLKAIKSIKIKIEEKRQLKMIYLSVMRNKINKLQFNAFTGLQKYKNYRQSRKNQNIRIQEFRQKQRLRKFFKYVKQGTLKLHDLRVNFLKVRTYVNRKLMFRTLQRFAQKLDKKQHLKYMLYQIIYKKETQIKQKIFYYMLNKRRELIHKFYQVHQMTMQHQRQNIFNRWYSGAQHIQQLRNGFESLQLFQIHNLEQQAFKAWQKYTHNQLMSKKYEQVATFFFLQQFLKKSLFALKNHALIRKQKRQILTIFFIHRVKKIWSEFRRVVEKDILKKKVYFRQVSTILKKCMVQWHQHAQTKSQRKYTLDQITQKRQCIQNLQILQVLHQNMTCKGLCEQDQYHYMRQIKQQKVLHLLRQHAYFRKDLKMKSQKLTIKNQTYIMKKNYRKWRSSYLINQLVSNKAIPHYQEKQELLKQQCFYALKQYMIIKQNLKANYHIIQDQNRINAKSKVIKALLENKQQNQRLKTISLELTQALLIQRKQSIFTVMKTNSQKQKILKFSFKALQEKNQVNILNSFFSYWQQKLRKQLIMKPKFQQAQELHLYLLAQRVLKMLKQAVTIRKKKEEMLRSISIYRNELITKNAFSKLKSNHRKEQFIMNFQHRSAVQFKQECYLEWRKLFIRALAIQRKNQNLQKYQYLKDKFLTLSTKRIFEQFKQLLTVRQQKNQGLDILFQVYDNIQLKQAIAALQQNVLQKRKEDQAAEYKEQQLKRIVFLRFKLYLKITRKTQTMVIQAEAFDKLRLFENAYSSLKQNRNKKQQMRRLYDKTNKLYRKSLSQKSLWTLQWNKMRNEYLRNLVFKSDEYNNKRVMQKLYDVLKNLLIMRYKTAQVQQKHEYQILNDYLGIWRYKWEQNEAQRQLTQFSLQQQYQQYQQNNDVQIQMNMGGQKVQGLQQIQFQGYNQPDTVRVNENNDEEEQKQQFY
eukprot:403340736